MNNICGTIIYNDSLVSAAFYRWFPKKAIPIPTWTLQNRETCSGLLHFTSMTDGGMCFATARVARAEKNNLIMLSAEVDQSGPGWRAEHLAPEAWLWHPGWGPCQTRWPSPISGDISGIMRVEHGSLLPAKVVNVRPNWQRMWFLITLIFSKS